MVKVQALVTSCGDCVPAADAGHVKLPLGKRTPVGARQAITTTCCAETAQAQFPPLSRATSGFAPLNPLIQTTRRLDMESRSYSGTNLAVGDD